MARALSCRDQYLSNHRLHLILMPTEQCNFRCTYCYEDFVQPQMSPRVVRAVRRFLARRAGELDLLSLSWYGGEPLLAFGVVSEVQAFAQSLAAEHPRLRLVSSMTTNAYRLDRRRFARLLELGVSRYQISLDGPREWHDRKRIKAGGQGTFDRIWSHLQTMHRIGGDFDVLLRLHVDRENRPVMGDLLRQIAGELEGDPRFRVFIRLLARLGGPNDSSLSVLEGEEKVRVVDDLRAQASALGLAQHKNHRPGAACYAAAVNSLVIRSNGDVAKCTQALSHPRNRVGRLREDGRLELSNSRMNGWTRGLWSGDPEELRCPMKGYAETAVPSVTASPLVAVGALAVD